MSRADWRQRPRVTWFTFPRCSKTAGPSLCAAGAYDLFELRIEAERVRPCAVVAGEIARLQNGLSSILGDNAPAPGLHADQNDFLARVAYPAPGAVDDLSVGADAREMHFVALRGCDFAEKGRLGNRTAIQLDEGIANRVTPELKSLCFGNRRGCQTTCIAHLAACNLSRSYHIRSALQLRCRALRRETTFPAGADKCVSAVALGLGKAGRCLVVAGSAQSVTVRLDMPNRQPCRRR